MDRPEEALFSCGVLRAFSLAGVSAGLLSASKESILELFC